MTTNHLLGTLDTFHALGHQSNKKTHWLTGGNTCDVWKMTCFETRLPHKGTKQTTVRRAEVPQLRMKKFIRWQAEYAKAGIEPSTPTAAVAELPLLRPNWRIKLVNNCWNAKYDETMSLSDVDAELLKFYKTPLTNSTWVNLWADQTPTPSSPPAAIIQTKLVFKQWHDTVLICRCADTFWIGSRGIRSIFDSCVLIPEKLPTLT